MSFWSNGVKAPRTNKDLWKLSVALANKHYNEVHLITDNKGYELLKDLPFKSFINILDTVPNYPDLWCLGKIYAYYYACQQGDFLHLDNDVLLWEKLPEDLTSSEIFVQSYDFQIYRNNKVCFSYDIESINNIIKCELPKEWQDIIDNKINLMTYNMGIFGGKNKELIKSYCEYVFNMVNDKKYENFWNTSISRPLGNSNNMPHLVKSCMVEQGNLGIFLKNNNIIPKMLFDTLWDDDNTTYRKYTHLMISKTQPDVIERVKNRVSKTPYDLTPVGCTPQQWSSKRKSIDFNYF
jgi:hypothetical protein